jgi:large subunit ribosomal protein L22
MESRATLRYLRLAPRKARLVIDLVRGRGVEDALGILEATPKRAAQVVAKNLRSAVANAETQQNVDVDRLFIKRAWVDEGPAWSRWMPRAQGRATPIQKKTSHITIVLDERS